MQCPAVFRSTDHLCGEIDIDGSERQTRARSWPREVRGSLGSFSEDARRASVGIRYQKWRPASRNEIPVLLDNGISVETGGHGERTFHEQDLIVVSPGVPVDAPPLRAGAIDGRSCYWRDRTGCAIPPRTDRCHYRIERQDHHDDIWPAKSCRPGDFRPWSAEILARLRFRSPIARLQKP